MGFRLRRFRRTVASMTPTEDCRVCQDQDQHSSHMSSRHLFDLATVNLANVSALALSLSEVEQWIRVAGCLLAGVFTALKIIETIRALKK
jgi:aminoglycoside/choline kinase family phosphotransferase